MAVFGSGIKLRRTRGPSVPATPVLPVATLTMSSYSQNEGNTGTVTWTGTVTLDVAAPAGGATGTWAVSGTGTNPANAADFGGTFPSGTWTITAGATSTNFNFTSTGDTTSESDETARLTIGATTNCTIGLGERDFTLVNDETLLAPAWDSVDADGWTATQASGLSATTIETGFDVTRQGFAADGTATTYVQRSQTNRRKAQLWPNAGTLEPDKVTLADTIFVGDVIAGGKTNNSTRTSPPPIGKWTVIHQRVVGESLRVASAWAHMCARNAQQIRCVRYTLSVGGVDKADVYVSTPTLSSNTGWARQVEEYSHTFDISNDTDFPENGVIKVRARAYPWFGRAADGSIYDTDSVTDYWLMRSIYFKKMSARFADPPIAIINRVTGNDTTGVIATVSTAATARANMFVTQTAAMQALIAAHGSLEGCEIWINADITAAQTTTPFNQTADRACDGFALTVKRDPTVGSVTVESFGGAYRLGPTPNAALDSMHLILEGINIGPGTGSPTGIRRAATAIGVPLDITFVDCGTAAGINLTQLRSGSGGDPARLFRFFGGNFARVVNAFEASSIGHNQYLGITATSLSKSTNRNLELHCNIGCEFSGFTTGANVAARNRNRETLIYFSRYMNAGLNNTYLWAVGAGAGADDNRGIAMVCSVKELNATERAMRWSGDSETAVIKHFVVHNVSTVGPPGVNAGWNILYDDTVPTRGVHRDISVKNTIGGSMPTKGDNFAGNAANVGNAEYAYGVNSRYIYSSDETGFNKQYMGRNSSLVPSGQTGINGVRDPLWTNQQVWISGAPGPGGGTYTLQVGSPCRGISDDRVTRYSIEGTEWAASGNALGAHA